MLGHEMRKGGFSFGRVPLRGNRLSGFGHWPRGLTGECGARRGPCCPYGGAPVW